MDCNSFSYINYSLDKNDIIKRVELSDGNEITLEFTIDYFQDKFFVVSDLYGNYYQDFTFSDIPLPGYMTKKEAMEKAIEFYNSIVPEKDFIVLC